MTLDLKLGDPWPFRSSRGIVGRKCDPVWHGLVTAPQKEAATAAQLEKAGCEVKYPTVETTRHDSQGRKVTRTGPMMPRIIYAQFTFEPQWDVMRQRRVIAGVFTVHGRPVALSEDDVARVMGLPTEAERIEAAEREARRPREGHKAEILSGPLSGFFVDVERVSAGRVWYSMVNGLKGQAPIDALQRVVDG